MPSEKSDGEGVVRSLTILVVEDAEEFRRFVCSLLKSKTEFEVDEAADGLEAVKKVQERQPGLVLLDIGLPDLNGIEVAKRVRELAPATRLLFVSGLSDRDIVNEALRWSAGYVHKPSVLNDLLPAIEAALRNERFVSPDLEL